MLEEIQLLCDHNESIIWNRKNEESKILHQIKVVLKHLVRGTSQKNRGVSKQSLAMCNCNAMDTKASILVELAFMTNEREASELMANKDYWKESAAEICRGICEYTGRKYIEEIYIPNPITKKSSKDDIKWLQIKLNNALKGHSFYPLDVDGDYGNKTRISVLIYWELLGWNKNGSNTGWKAGKKTLEALVEGKI